MKKWWDGKYTPIQLFDLQQSCKGMIHKGIIGSPIVGGPGRGSAHPCI